MHGSAFTIRRVDEGRSRHRHLALLLQGWLTESSTLVVCCRVLLSMETILPGTRWPVSGLESADCSAWFGARAVPYSVQGAREPSSGISSTLYWREEMLLLRSPILPSLFRLPSPAILLRREVSLVDGRNREEGRRRRTGRWTDEDEAGRGGSIFSSMPHIASGWIPAERGTKE